MSKRRIYSGSSALAAAALGVLPLAGCVSHEDDGHHHRRPRERETIVEEQEQYHRPPVVVEPDPVIVERGPRVEHEPIHDRGPVERARGIPRSAALVEEGKGRIGFRSRRDGDVWIEDTHDLKLVFQGRLFDDEELVVDPGQDRILINGQRVRVNGLINEHRHRIYFIPATVRYERYIKGRDPRFDR